MAEEIKVYGVSDEGILADVRAMIEALQQDKVYGPYSLRMSHQMLRALNPALADAIEEAGPDVPFEILLDDRGLPCGWRRLL